MTTGVKICGLRTAETVAAALDGGAAMVGLVLVVKSPRHVGLDDAAALAAVARGRARVVALTCDADDVAIAEIMARVAPDLLQLHGQETPERVRELKARHGVGVIKAVAVSERDDVARAHAYRGAGLADLVLFDAKPPAGALYTGGHGVTFDWRLLAGVKGRADVMLAGGLTADNVGEAVRLVQPGFVDVSSGVETRPGEKSTALIGRFLQAVKDANNEVS